MLTPPGIPDRTLIWGTAITQFIGWGTLYFCFPLLVAPMEAELGWSRVLINGALTGGLLVAGLLAVPAGRWLDTRGARGMMTLGALAGALLLVAWSVVDHPVAYVVVWLAIGVVHATALWGPAMAVVVAEARDPMRIITAITFITGFTATVFLPLTELLVQALGWRGALQALAAMQLVSAWLTWRMLRDARPPAGDARSGPPAGLMRRLRDPAFLGLALCIAAHAFIATALAAHLIPLLRERGWPEATVLLIAAAQGPAQVAARALLYAARQGLTMRRVGVFATALVPLAMIALALGGANIAMAALFMLLWSVGDGLMGIVRAAGTADILGREDYGAISGALTAVSTLPRTSAPLIVALVWEGAGSYGPVPWLLAAVGALSVAGFIVAARR
ncbi:MFS transporter [Roseomonas terrae]|jgi:predicted MFS family arabinose efflux permease|uniref:MFS transporter n=1 Tax=Neoroseomonas terrae TaxID=424799 RepID=A0ABS5ECQ1_9PROT|nr:MFS transporter [Neoroseomonas terrae]MBR0648477.1 MFS transporter [Neoroseomonas terrae]